MRPIRWPKSMPRAPVGRARRDVARTRSGRGSRAWSVGAAGCTSLRCTRRSRLWPRRASATIAGRSAPSSGSRGRSRRRRCRSSRRREPIETSIPALAQRLPNSTAVYCSGSTGPRNACCARNCRWSGGRRWWRDHDQQPGRGMATRLSSRRLARGRAGAAIAACVPGADPCLSVWPRCSPQARCHCLAGCATSVSSSLTGTR